MPHVHEKEGVKILRSKDRRVKLTYEQRQVIKDNPLGLSQRALAREYGVSRRTITFIQDPHKLEENLERRKERGGSAKYYDAEKHREYMKDHRHYKKRLHEEGFTYKDENTPLTGETDKS